MQPKGKSNAMAASWLAVVFVWTSCVMLFVEPGMGFRTPADFLDPVKVAAGYGSTVWFVSNLLYFSVPVAVMSIVVGADDRLLQWSGLGTSVLWLVLASMDRVGTQLPDLLSEEAVITAHTAGLPVRFAVLKAAGVTFGVFAWRTTRLDPLDGAGERLWRGLGWLMLLIGVVFVLFFVPLPIAFAVWAVAWAVREAYRTR